MREQSPRKSLAPALQLQQNRAHLTSSDRTLQETDVGDALALQWRRQPCARALCGGKGWSAGEALVHGGTSYDGVIQSNDVGRGPKNADLID